MGIALMKILDKNRDSMISIDELFDFYTNVGHLNEELALEETTEFMKTGDLNEDGILNRQGNNIQYYYYYNFSIALNLK